MYINLYKHLLVCQELTTSSNYLSRLKKKKNKRSLVRSTHYASIKKVKEIHILCFTLRLEYWDGIVPFFFHTSLLQVMINGEVPPYIFNATILLSHIRSYKGPLSFFFGKVFNLLITEFYNWFFLLRQKIYNS